MKVLIINDLHLDAWIRQNGGLFIIDSFYEEFIKPFDFDVLAIAGDIANGETSFFVLNKLADCLATHQKIIYTPGNHDFYKSYLLQYRQQKENLSNKVIYLQYGEIKELDGKTFCGATLWYNPQHSYEQSHDFFHGLSGEIVWEDYQKTRDNLLNLIKSQVKIDCALWHHIPYASCVDPKYRAELNTRYFYTGKHNEVLVDKLNCNLHLFGHTHTPTCQLVGKDKYAVNNAFGYPFEDINTQKGLIWEI